MKIDAVIVLGFGVKDNGSLSLAARSRVEKGVEVSQEYKAPLVMSGKWPFTSLTKPPITEAQAMASFARKLGAAEGLIIKEEESMDTIGNAYFTKNKVVKPNSWRSLTIVTTDFHLERVKLAFQKVYGSDYNLEFVSVTYPNLSQSKKDRLVHNEQVLIKLGNKFSARVEDGDDQTIKELLFKHHPAYSRGLTWKKLKLVWFYIIYKFFIL